MEGNREMHDDDESGPKKKELFTNMYDINILLSKRNLLTQPSNPYTKC